MKEKTEMSDRDAVTQEKILAWIWLAGERFLGALAPICLVGLISVMCTHAVLFFLHLFGVGATISYENSAEDAVLASAVIVIPLLLRIARVLDQLASRLA
jgi:hypothetical protein